MLQVLLKRKFLLCSKKKKLSTYASRIVLCFDIPKKLCVVARYCRVLTEGPYSEFFRESTDYIGGVEDNIPVVDEGSDPIKKVLNLTGNLRGDVARLILDGFEVEDDNEPAEINIPAPTQTKSNLNEVQF